VVSSPRRLGYSRDVPPTRSELASTIAERLERDAEALRAAFAAARPVRHFVADDLLPAEWLEALNRVLPDPSTLALKSSLRERKRVGVAVREYAPLVGDTLFAFQDPRVVAAIAAITGLTGLEADPTLYASGISAMGDGDFLNPHLDNSHDGDQQRYRVLNLLLYVSPGWDAARGGSLELWEHGPRAPRAIEARFARLVVMETGPESWHSVDRISSPDTRWCVSNYYFSKRSVTGRDYRHVTTFAGRPDEPFKRVALAVDGAVLNALGRAFPRLLGRTKHRMRDA